MGKRSRSDPAFSNEFNKDLKHKQVINVASKYYYSKKEAEKIQQMCSMLVISEKI